MTVSPTTFLFKDVKLKYKFPPTAVSSWLISDSQTGAGALDGLEEGDEVMVGSKLCDGLLVADGEAVGTDDSVLCVLS